MACNKRFGKRYSKSGELEIVIRKDASFEYISPQLGPYSISNPPSSTEFPDWPTLAAAIKLSEEECAGDQEVTHTLCKIDDTLSDGTALVQYTEVYVFNRTTDQFELLSTYQSNDPTSTYTPVGTTYLTSEYGTAAKLGPEREQLVGPMIWVTTDEVTSFSIKPITIGGDTTFTDVSNRITPIIENEVIQFGADQSDPSLLKSPVIITVDAGDELIVEYLSLTI